MSRETFYKMLQSILIGAIVAFLSSLFEGLLDLLKGPGNNLLGGGAASVAYLIRKR